MRFVILSAMIDKNSERHDILSHHTKLFSLLMPVILLIAGVFLTACAAQITPAQAVLVTAESTTAVSTPTLFLSTITSSPTATNTHQPTNTLPPTATATEVLPTMTPTDTAVPTDIPLPLPPGTPFPLPTATNPPPLPTPQNAYSLTLKVPILMYHYISIPPEDADKYRINLSIPPETFRIQMEYLYHNGYTTIDLYDLSRAIADKQELPAKPIILTFDDGYLDNYENAYPVLQEFGFKGTFFIPTEFIDIGREGYMTWPIIKEMAANGHRFEPHSRTHPDLRSRSHNFLVWEILGPQETLAAHLGYTPRYFAYPSGRYDDKVIQTLRDLHFWGAVTTESGTWHGFEDRYEWTRMRIAYDYSLQDFIDRVELKDTVEGKRVERN